MTCKEKAQKLKAVKATRLKEVITGKSAKDEFYELMDSEFEDRWDEFALEECPKCGSKNIRVRCYRDDLVRTMWVNGKEVDRAAIVEDYFVLVKIECPDCGLYMDWESEN